MVGFTTNITVRQRVILTLCGFCFLIIILGLGLGYIRGYYLVSRILGQENLDSARLLSQAIGGLIKKEMNEVSIYFEDPLSIEVIQAANSRNPQNNQGLTNPLSLRLKRLVEKHEQLINIIITDNQGRAVAASGSSEEFYRNDEEWWQSLLDPSRHGFYVGAIDFDASTKKFVIPMAKIIKDENGSVLGAGRMLFDLELFFGPLNDFKIGKTGRAILTNDQGQILYDRGVSLIGTKLFSSDEIFQGLLESEKGWVVVKPFEFSPNRFFLTKEAIHLPELERNKIYYNVVVVRDFLETFEPLNVFAKDVLLIGLLLLICMIPIGYKLGTIFIRPIEDLQSNIQKIVEGHWELDIKMNRKDELGKFADAFRHMLFHVRGKQEELLTAKKELEDFSKDLENKVAQRTSELSRTQEATLNVLEDLTEAKEKLEEALQVKSEFTAMVSHELRTPLTAIKEGIGLVSEGVSGEVNPKQQELLNIAKRNTDRLSRLVNSILNFQRLETGMIEFRMQKHDLNVLVQEVVHLMLPVARQKGLDIMIQLQEDLPATLFDYDYITQVLTNLVNNAIKFTDKGFVEVKTILNMDVLQVTVSDTGIGIKEEDIPKLFQQFVQLHDQGQRPLGGSGLGLAICRQIIKAHGGKIWIESEIGSGSRFIFVLPVKEEERV